MKKEFSILLAITILLIASFSGCFESDEKQDDANKFLGKWKYEFGYSGSPNFTLSMIFFENGTVRYKGLDLNYEIRGSILSIFFNENESQYNYEFSNGNKQLKLTPSGDSYQDILILNKVENGGRMDKYYGKWPTEMPYLILDSNDNPIIIYGLDLKKYTGENGTDGEDDVIVINKFNSNGEKIIDNETLISSKAIANPAIAKISDNEIYIVWLDPRNNPDYESYDYSYYTDIYYKKIDMDGNILINDTKLNDELLEKNEAYSNFNLSDYEDIPIDGTIEDLHYVNCLYGEIGIYTSTYTRILIDFENNEHYFKISSQYTLEASKITYTKIDSEGNILVDEKEIVVYAKGPDSIYTTEIQNVNMEIDSQDNIHIVWQINAGYTYYYMKLNDDGEILINKELLGKF